jgi:hypothetical protein
MRRAKIAENLNLLSDEGRALLFVRTGCRAFIHTRGRAFGACPLLAICACCLCRISHADNLAAASENAGSVKKAS